MKPSAEGKVQRLLLLDDEPNILSSLRRLLAAAPCAFNGVRYRLELECFQNPVQALARARHYPFDLFLVDFRMPDMDGVSFLRAVREAQPDAARLILSGYADLNALTAAINEAHVFRFISKPWLDYELVSAIAQALGYRELALENQRLADLMRVQNGSLTPQELELKRLEALEPGITRVRWGADGAVLLDEP